MESVDGSLSDLITEGDKKNIVCSVDIVHGASSPQDLTMEIANGTTGKTIHLSINQSIGKTMHQSSINQQVRQSINPQLINQRVRLISINQSMGKTINQSLINQSTGKTNINQQVRQ